jgi:hypothetical protein
VPIGFLLGNVVVWLLMTVLLVVVPDVLEERVGTEVARVIGWAVACTVWVVAIEAQWKVRVGPVNRVVLQFLLWVSAALTAIWVTEQVTP